MKIALDYDGTYTLDPTFWDHVIAAGQARGHEFVCVTARAFPPADDEPRIPIPIVCVPLGLKRKGAMEEGHLFDVWIDDCPGMIEETLILAWENPL